MIATLTYVRGTQFNTNGLSWAAHLALEVQCCTLISMAFELIKCKYEHVGHKHF